MTNRLKLSLIGVLVVGVCMFDLSSGSSFGLEPANSKSVENGRKKFDEFTVHSKLPTAGGSCWKSALEFLQTGCATLTEEVHARMTFRFMSCFNEMIGLPVYVCERTTPIQTCMKQLDPASVGTYRDYFLHTQDMCYFLRQEVFQEESKRAVQRLHNVTADVTSQMEQQKSMQEKLLESQQKSYEVQANMQKENEELFTAVTHVKGTFELFAETAREHQIISSEIFDKLTRLQKLVSWIQGEMSMLDMVLFYAVSMLMGYLATACQRTASARYVLLLLFMASVVMEKMLYTLLNEYEYHPEEIVSYIWIIRKGSALCAMITVLIAGAIYRDPLVANNKMLMGRLDDITRMLSESVQNNRFVRALTPNRLQLNENAAIEDDDSSDDSFSDYSADDSEDDLDQELRDITLDEELSSGGGNEENRQPTPTGPGFGFVRSAKNLKGIIRKRSVKFTSPNPSKDESVSHSQNESPYGFRPRSSTPSKQNPILQHESTNDFAKIIKRRSMNYFSSDEELFE